MDWSEVGDGALSRLFLVVSWSPVDKEFGDEEVASVGSEIWHGGKDIPIIFVCNNGGILSVLCKGVIIGLLVLLTLLFTSCWL